MPSEFTSKFCKQCGAATITHCTSCNAPIRGFHTESFSWEWHPGAHCYECGHPYPWSAAKLAAVSELADAIAELTEYEREVLAELMPHLVQETPRTQPAGFKVATIVGKLKDPGAAALKKLLEEIAVEAGKKALGF